MTTEAPLWVHKIGKELLSFIESVNPINSPEFPFELFAQRVGAALHMLPLVIRSGVREWRMQDNLLAGLGKSPLSVALTVSPLEGDLSWIMPLEDVGKWVSWMQDEEGTSFDLENPDLIKSLYKYSLLEVLSELSKTAVYKGLVFRLSEKPKFDAASYTIDVSISKEDETLWGRLVISSALMRSFSTFYATKKLGLTELNQFQDLSLPVVIRNGSIKLKESDLKALREGDFIIVDNASYHPNKESGGMKLCLHETPLFFIKPKENKLKILDYVQEEE